MIQYVTVAGSSSQTHNRPVWMQSFISVTALSPCSSLAPFAVCLLFFSTHSLHCQQLVQKVLYCRVWVLVCHVGVSECLCTFLFRCLCLLDTKMTSEVSGSYSRCGGVDRLTPP